VTFKKLLIITILLVLSTLSAGCASIGKDVPVQEGVDIIWVKKGQTVTAPVDGAFLSNSFYKFQFDRCK
jgi:predicted small secreted protein